MTLNTVIARLYDLREGKDIPVNFYEWGISFYILHACIINRYLPQSNDVKVFKSVFDHIPVYFHSTIFFVLFPLENWDDRRGLCRVRSKRKLAVDSYYTVKICSLSVPIALTMCIVCLGCLWTHQKMREPNSSVVLEPSGSSGELFHRFLQHTRRRWSGKIFVSWWHHVSAGVPWAVRTVDREVHTQSAQSQKDRISIRLSGDGCGDEPFTT